MVELKENRTLPGQTVAAFSLFESVVAIAIISVLIGIGTIVYSNLVEAERPIAFYQAKEEIDLYYHTLQQSKAFFSKMYEHETFSIEQKVDFHNGNKKIYRVEYFVTSQNKMWYSEKHLLTNPNYVQ